MADLADPGFDQDALDAVADLVGRAGASDFSIGYEHDDAPHSWYAEATLRGTKVAVREKEDPIEAAEGLARRLLTGAQCNHCKQLVTLNDLAGENCRWRRMGSRWVRGCE